MRTKIFIGIGSNIDRENNVKAAITELRERYGEIVISPVYESEPIGFDGDNFCNLVVSLESTLPLEAIIKDLHEIEAKYGRDKNVNPYSSRTLDLDLLLYGDLVKTDGYLQIPRDDIVEYAFVLKPLADIAGDVIHPVIGCSFSELWNDFTCKDQRLWRIDPISTG